MTQKLEALHLEALCNENLVFWSQKHTEVETVDLVLKLKNKLLQADREHLPVKADTLKKLQTHINDIILALPDDLQDILLKTGTTWFLLGYFGAKNQKASNLTEDSGLPSLEHSSKPVH